MLAKMPMPAECTNFLRGRRRDGWAAKYRAKAGRPRRWRVMSADVIAFPNSRAEERTTLFKRCDDARERLYAAFPRPALSLQQVRNIATTMEALADIAENLARTRARLAVLAALAFTRR